MTARCTQCSRPVTEPVPETWTKKYPELAGLCLDFVSDWQLMHDYDGQGEVA